MGLPPFSAFKVCHLVSKSVYYETANPKVVKVPSFNEKLVFKLRNKIFFFEVDDVIAISFRKNDVLIGQIGNES